MICYCGHDCSRCKTYIATITNDDKMRYNVIEFYKSVFNIELKLADINCHGGRSEFIMNGCKQCPWMKCAKSREIESCTECNEYPCPPLDEYIKKYVNKYNQIHYQ